MIQVNGFIINEKLIKVAMNWFESPKDCAAAMPPYPQPKTKIFFTDGSEMILEMPCNCIYDELKRLESNEDKKVIGG